MKYTITIEKTVEKTIHDSRYVGKETVGASADGYAYEDRIDEVSESIYEQSTESEIDLKGIIDAFNKQAVDTTSAKAVSDAALNAEQ